VQTTGSGIVCNVHVNDGNQANEHIYSDLDTDTLNNLPVGNPHRHVDDFLVEKSKSACFDLVLIGPTTVFGSPIRTVASNPHSSQIPWAIAVAFQNKAVYQVGEGKNSWSFVHIDDLAALYYLVVKKLVRNELDPATHLGRNGYFLPESGYYEWRQAYETIGQQLHSLGAIPSPTPKIIVDDDEFAKVYKFLPFKFGYGGSSRVSADKCKQIGWVPRRTLDDFLADIGRESRVFAKKHGLNEE
jgi:nucleoside-diphosphate-sugar epimerase